MVPIGHIASMTHPGVFRNFKWPSELPPFGRYNLIYGWNGSGKTTISRMLRALEARTPPADAEVVLSINGANVPGHQFDRVTLPVRVFNRDFVSESVFPAGGGNVPLILMVGRETVERQKQVGKLREKLSRVLSALETAHKSKQRADRELDRYCVERARLIKETLRSPGPSPHNNYDKSSFRDRAQKLGAANEIATYHLDEAERERLLAQHRATPKPKLQILRYTLPSLVLLVDAVSKTLSDTVISVAIQSLKDDPDLSSWVYQGLGLHQSRSADTCLFCAQTLPKDRLAVLQAHFSVEYDKFLAKVKEQLAGLQSASEAATSLSMPNRAEFYDDLAAEYDLARISLEEALRSTRETMDLLVRALEDKKSRAFESCQAPQIANEVDPGSVGRVNEAIRKHNEACSGFETRAIEARQRLEDDLVARALGDIRELSSAVNASEQSFREATAQKEVLDTQIARLEREIVESRQPAEELNDDLQRYLGHCELRLEVKENGYGITRDGFPARELSEGEITAIALLYFLKSLQDRRFEMGKGVVVLDDPVSSLDANALYLAFGFIRERTQGAAQLFILTHNFTLFRQVRNWFHHLKGQKKADVSQRPARFYMLDCARAGDRRVSSLRPLDPLLERYESEYHYLFACVYREAQAVASAGLEDNYILPNVARRLLESFLAFRQPQVAGDLWQKMKSSDFDESRKTRILRFLNTHSHGDTIGEPEHDPSLLGEARVVLGDLLDFIKHQDPHHYEAMVELVTSVDEAGEEFEELKT